MPHKLSKKWKDIFVLLVIQRWLSLLQLQAWLLSTAWQAILLSKESFVELKRGTTPENFQRENSSEVVSAREYNEAKLGPMQ